MDASEPPAGADQARLDDLERRLAVAEAAVRDAATELADVARELSVLRRTRVDRDRPDGEAAVAVGPPGEATPEAVTPSAQPLAKAGASDLVAARREIAAEAPGLALYALERAWKAVAAAGNDPISLGEIAELALSVGNAHPRYRNWASDLLRRCGLAAFGQPAPAHPRSPVGATSTRPRGGASAPAARPAGGVSVAIEGALERVRSMTRASLEDGPVVDRLASAARAWLTGARLLALGGALVSLLGVVLIFTLAVDRGWIGETERVLIGAAISAALVGSAFLLRSKGYDELSVTAAAATGIAGGFITLFVASAPYDLVPDAAAPVGLAAISGLAVALALSWRVQFLAVFGLVGSMVGPALVRGDVDAPAFAFAFALVAFALALGLAWRLGWRPLLALTGGVGTILAAIYLLAEDGDAYVALASGVAGLAYLAAAALSARLWRSQGHTVAFLAVPPVLAAAYLNDGPARWVLVGATALAALAALGSRHFALRGLTTTTVGLVALFGALATAAVVGEESMTTAWVVEGLVLVGLLLRLRQEAFLLSGLAYLALGGVVLVFQDLEHVLEDTGGTPSVVRLGLYAACSAAAAVGLAVLRWDGLGQGAGVSARAVRIIVRGRVEVQISVRTGSAAALAAALSIGLDGLALSLAATAAAVALVLVNAWRSENDLDALGALFLLIAFAAFLADRRVGSPIAWGVAAAVFALLVATRSRPERTAIASSVGLVVALGGLLAIDGERLLQLDVRSWESVVAWLVLAAAGAFACRIDHRLLTASQAWASRSASATFAAALAGLAIAAALALALGGLALVACLSVAGIAAAALLRVTAADRLVGAVALAFVYPLYVTDEDIDGSGMQALGLVLIAVAACAAAELATSDRRALAFPKLTEVPGLLPEDTRRALIIGLQLLSLGLGLAALTLAIEHEAWRAATTAAVAVVLAGGLRFAAGWRMTGQVALPAVAVIAVAETLSVAPLHRLFAREASTGAMVATAAALSAATVACATLLTLNARFLAEDVRRLTLRMALGLGGVATVFALSHGMRALVPELGGNADAQFQRGQTAVSILWALVAIGLLFVGLTHRRRPLRLGGFVLLTIAVAKIFLFDLDQLSSLARALSFLGVGLLILAGGWLVQRYAERVSVDEPPG
jgi:uncharacterized membrane protein